jgi:REP element-mobilizing transposase RayT
MPRRPRLHVPGGLFHIVLRGNGRQDIFFDVQDRLLWEQCLQTELDRHKHRVHAYCWMTNHVHLAIEAHTAPLGGFMATLASRYAKALNKKLRRSGHLFERRYRSTLVQAESYLLELVRYIHLNPVRAGIVSDPSQYRWSSHAAYFGGTSPRWLTSKKVLLAFGKNEQLGRRSYAKFMQEVPSRTVIDNMQVWRDQDDGVLGDEDFLRSVTEAARLAPAIGSLDIIVEQACLRYGVTEADLASPSRSRLYAKVRAAIALEAFDRGVASVTEVARRFGRTQPSLSRAMGRLRKRETSR